MQRVNLRTTVFGLSIAALVSSYACAQDAPEGYSITPIAGGVYRAMNQNHGTVFLVTDEGIVLADPVNTDFATWLKQEFAERFGVPVRYVVYSHYHWDHASGGAVFADTAKFVGHANMLAHLAMPPPSTSLAEVQGQYAPVAALDGNGDGVVSLSEIPEDFRRFPGSQKSQFLGFDANEDGVLSGAEVLRGPVSFVRPPEITYSSALEIRLGGKRINMSWVGKMNHSMDTSMITFPDDGVMYIVDYVTFGRVPNREMDYELGMFEEWMAAIIAAEELSREFDFVATGHGPVGNSANVAAWRSYMEKLRDQVAAGIAAGHTLEQMQADIDMEEYSDWADFQWVDLNVVGMYHFLTDAN
jgi:glyoxylase-like metal-dependent hydrolase (beta-lactamase superfamily II)